MTLLSLGIFAYLVIGVLVFVGLVRVGVIGRNEAYFAVLACFAYWPIVLLALAILSCVHLGRRLYDRVKRKEAA